MTTEPKKRLYKAIVEFEVIVWAEGEEQAEHLAEKHAKEELSNFDHPVSEVSTVETLNDLPPGWSDGHPYGHPDEEATCAQILMEKVTSKA